MFYCMLNRITELEKSISDEAISHQKLLQHQTKELKLKYVRMHRIVISASAELCALRMWVHNCMLLLLCNVYVSIHTYICTHMYIVYDMYIRTYVHEHNVY